MYDFKDKIVSTGKSKSGPPVSGTRNTHKSRMPYIDN